MLDMYEILSDAVAEEATTEIRDNMNLGDEISESDVDSILWEKAMYICRGDEDHYDVIDLAKAKLDCWDVIIPHGA